MEYKLLLVRFDHTTIV